MDYFWHNIMVYGMRPELPYPKKICGLLLRYMLAVFYITVYYILYVISYYCIDLNRRKYIFQIFLHGTLLIRVDLKKNICK